MTKNLTDQANWDNPLFPVSVAAQAAAIEPGTLRMWLQRGRISLAKGEAEAEPAALPDRPGLPRMLTLRTVLTIAAAAPLVRAGVQVADAYAAAKEWTWFAEWNPAPLPGRMNYKRDPGGLFPDPHWTFLIYHGPENSKVVPVAPDGDCLPFKFGDLFGSVVPSAASLVFLNKVDHYARNVCEDFLREEAA